MIAGFFVFVPKKNCSGYIVLHSYQQCMESYIFCVTGSTCIDTFIWAALEGMWQSLTLFQTVVVGILPCAYLPFRLA